MWVFEDFTSSLNYFTSFNLIHVSHQSIPARIRLKLRKEYGEE